MANPKSAYSIPTKKGKPDTHIIVVWVDNEAGVLARVVGLFSGRGYNIESLAVAEIDAAKNISRITIVTTGTPQVIDQIKLQLKKLELIRLLSSQMLNRKRLGRDIFMRGSKSGVKSIYDKKVSLTLFELLKAYSGIVMTKDFHTMNIPKLPVFTTEDAIKRIKEFFGNLNEWKNVSDLVPSGFKNSPNLKKTGKAGIFAGSLELVKEGNVSLKQKELFDDIFIKEN